MNQNRKYVTASIPIGIAKDIDKLIEEMGYWPSRGAFVREACTERKSGKKEEKSWNCASKPPQAYNVPTRFIFKD